MNMKKSWLRKQKKKAKKNKYYENTSSSSSSSSNVHDQNVYDPDYIDETVYEYGKPILPKVEKEIKEEKKKTSYRTSSKTRFRSSFTTNFSSRKLSSHTMMYLFGKIFLTHYNIRS